MKYFEKISAKKQDSAAKETTKNLASGFGGGLISTYITQPLERAASKKTVGVGQVKDLKEELKAAKGIRSKAKIMFQGANQRALKGAIMGGTMFGSTAAIKTLWDRMEKEK
jgi:CRISPR/Cas system CSM-associated protein Csm5 (group 7 of RAMP superfamily)